MIPTLDELRERVREGLRELSPPTIAGPNTSHRLTYDDTIVEAVARAIAHRRFGGGENAAKHWRMCAEDARAALAVVERLFDEQAAQCWRG
jgi:hypothetical protein